MTAIDMKRDELIAKLAHIRRDVPFADTLAVTFDADVDQASASDDFQRETAFYNQALSTVKKAIPMLEKLNIPVFRPDDYFAEMNKTDNHMHKVRERLLDIQTSKQKSEKARRTRDERKFASKAQTLAVEQKQAQKRKFVEAVKKHRKGMKDQLETMLDNAKDWEDKGDMAAEEGNRTKKRRMMGTKMSRKARDTKFGYGGQKKRSKKNDSKSFNDIFEGKAKSSFKTKGKGKAKSNKGR